MLIMIMVIIFGVSVEVRNTEYYKRWLEGGQRQEFYEAWSEHVS